MNTAPLRHPAEIPFYIFAVVGNIVIILLAIGGIAFAILSRLGLLAEVLILIVLLAAAIVVLSREVSRRTIRGNAVRLSREQFPDIYQIMEEFATKLGMKQIPEIFLQQQNGVMNAFATESIGKTYIVINSEIFSNMYKDDQAGLAFIIGHELAHIKLHHTRLWKILSTLFFSAIPLLGTSLQRVYEYSCDRHGAYLSPNGMSGLLILSVGRYVYKELNVNDYLQQTNEVHGWFSSFVQAFYSHPYIAKRVRVLLELGLLQRPSPVQPQYHR